MRATGLFFLIYFFAFSASGELCNPAQEHCWGFGRRSTSAPALPSNSSSINLNPSAVPLGDTLGVEALTFKGQWDFTLTKGTGRVGAGLSLTNAEETFFGPPGFELPPDFLQRQIDQEKYDTQKLTLATAISLFDNRESGLHKVLLNLGVLGRYNKMTKTPWPGGGVSGVAGPFTFGFSNSRDEYRVDFSSLGIEEQFLQRYTTENFSVGVFLTNFVFDYSLMHIYAEGMDPWTVRLLTGSLLLKKWIFTASQRSEDSTRPLYDDAQKTLVPQQIKVQNFYGIQYAATKTLMFGAFYNYYLLRDVSIGLTLFF